MKNRIVLILLAVVLVVSVGFMGCGAGGVPVVTEHTLTISSSHGGSVTTPGEGTGSFTYDEGDAVDLVAEPDEGYRFENWAGDVGSVGDVNAASTTIVMNGDYEITANFAPEIPFKNPDSFVQMSTGDAESFDPAWVWDDVSAEQVGYIYETLIYFDGTKIDEFVPVLATEWELLDDNVTYRFKIRKGVKFHEGGDLTPSDVEYSFERALVQDRHLDGSIYGPVWTLYQPLLGLDGSRDWDGNMRVTFDQIDDTVEVDGDWVVFHLVDPAWGLAFLQILSQPLVSSPASIVDKEWCVAHGEWDGSKETWLDYNNPDKTASYLYDHTNGTGPWKLDEWAPGVQVRLVRNDNYWREPAPFERVITQFVDEWSSRKEALLAGDADLVDLSLPWNTGNWSRFDDIEELEGIADLKAYQGLPELIIEAFFFKFNMASGSEYIGSGVLDGNGIPPNFFSDIDVRKGFNYAFDWETYINDIYMSDAEQRGSPIIEGLPFYDPDASMYSLDLARAEEHLRAAWGGQVWEKGFKFTLLYNPGNLSRETACKILAENLAKINPRFQVGIQPMNWATGIFPGIRSGLVPMFQTGWIVDYPHADNIVVPFMASYGAFAQLQSYGYPELDELIQGAFKELDPSLQQDMYYDLQERYYEDAPSIMLVQPLGRRYFTKYIEGFYFNPMIPGQAGPLYYMSKSSS